jgi:hypothetical protein
MSHVAIAPADMLPGYPTILPCLNRCIPSRNQKSLETFRDMLKRTDTRPSQSQCSRDARSEHNNTRLLTPTHRPFERRQIVRKVELGTDRPSPVVERTNGAKITSEGFVIRDCVAHWVVAALRDRAGDVEWRCHEAMGLEIRVT